MFWLVPALFFLSFIQWRALLFIATSGSDNRELFYLSSSFHEACVFLNFCWHHVRTKKGEVNLYVMF